MAKLTGDWAPNVRRSFKGAAYIYRRGDQTIMASMPRQGPRKKSEKQLAAMDLMRRRSLAIKAMVPELVHAASFYARDNALMPRDYLFMSMAGRHTSVFMPESYINGVDASYGVEGRPQLGPPIWPFTDKPRSDKLKRIYSMATLHDLTELFDIYGEWNGNILTRRNGAWSGLETGPAGTVLQVGSDGNLEWGSGGAGGGGLTIAGSVNGALSTTNYCHKGNLFRSPVAVTYRGVMADNTWVAGRSYIVTVMTVVGGLIDTILTQSAPWVAPSSYLGPRYIPLDQPYTAQPDEQVAIMIGHLGVANGTRIQLIQSGTPFTNFPLGEPTTAIQVWETNIAVGQTVNNQGQTFLNRALPGWAAP